MPTVSICTWDWRSLTSLLPVRVRVSVRVRVRVRARVSVRAMGLTQPH